MEFVTYKRFWYKFGQYHAFEFKGSENKRRIWNFLNVHGLEAFKDDNDIVTVNDPTIDGLSYRIEGPMVILCSLDNPNVVKFISTEEFKAECREVNPFI